MNIIFDCWRIRTLTFVCGLLGFTQGLITFAIGCYFCTLYLTDYIPTILNFPLWAIITRGVTIGFDDTMKGLITTVTVFHFIWMISSLLLLLGNFLNRVIGLTQWVVVTAIITIFDIIFMIYFISMTSDLLSNLFGWEQETDITREELVKGYIMLLFVFGKFGLLMWLVNLYLAYIVYRRATELLQAIKTEDEKNSYITLETKSVQIGSINLSLPAISPIKDLSKNVTNWGGSRGTTQSRLIDGRGNLSDGVCY